MGRILIAEDEDRLAAFIEKGLQKYGFSTAIATNGEQAILMVENDEFDLLLLDLGLPLKDGWAVLSELRRQGKKFPIIIVTARDDVKENQARRQYGANDYVSKPFRFQDLLARIHHHLE
ncbi:response regulator [Candidatus Gracilibacteria bacterium]|nr:response regulator [Candidatus Gracilibacteria bacterium]NJM87603.1 response regulator [Hydrococcus sp. RU_2_2]NJP18291.1 response regulator [Hydrococcus sp. CRU_1_1]NJQ98572.1 response regulator [Hydrococcus sp. CSU_1_8]